MDSSILDHDDLALIRASLRYWIDEMSRHGEDIWTPYFERDRESRDGSDTRANRVLQRLESVELRYIAVDIRTPNEIWVKLVSDPIAPSSPDVCYGIALIPTPH